MNVNRHLLQYVQGLGARSSPAANMFGRSGFAISVRAIVTPSQSPRSIELRITDAVWKPPVTRTGTVAICFNARASGRLIPSGPPALRAGFSQWRFHTTFAGHERK